MKKELVTPTAVPQSSARATAVVVAAQAATAQVKAAVVAAAVGAVKVGEISAGPIGTATLESIVISQLEAVTSTAAAQAG